MLNHDLFYTTPSFCARLCSCVLIACLTVNGNFTFGPEWYTTGGRGKVTQMDSPYDASTAEVKRSFVQVFMICLPFSDLQMLRCSHAGLDMLL